MADLFAEFLETPNGTTFTALREWLIQQPEYDYASLDLDEVAALTQDENFGAVIDQGDDAMPNWVLSPSMHQYLAEAARSQGDEDRAKVEEYLIKACLAGLSQSGDGSAEKPYLLTHPADEYDLVESLGKVVTEHTTLVDLASPLSRVTCEDGTILHFDVSAGLQSANQANS